MDNREEKKYEIIKSTRLLITRLVPGEFNPLEKDGVLIDSMVEWLGPGSEIIIKRIKPPAEDIQKISKHIQKLMERKDG